MTPTPTAFDLSNVFTRTPGPAAQCPLPTFAETVSVAFFDFSLADGFTDQIQLAEENTLDFLNKYGGDQLAAELRRLGKDKPAHWGYGFGKSAWIYQDLTHDGTGSVRWDARIS